MCIVIGGELVFDFGELFYCLMIVVDIDNDVVFV